MTVFVQLLTAFLGALGFAVLFGVLRRCLWVAAVGGMLTWGVYLAVDAWLHVEFLCQFLHSPAVGPSHIGKDLLIVLLLCSEIFMHRNVLYLCCYSNSPA